MASHNLTPVRNVLQKWLHKGPYILAQWRAYLGEACRAFISTRNPYRANTWMIVPAKC